MKGFKRIISLIEKHKTKQSLLSCRPHNISECFVLCVCYRRSNFFETRQMGKVVQHHKNILNSSPDLLRGVACHQTQIVLYQIDRSNYSLALGLSKKLHFHKKKMDQNSFDQKEYIFFFTISIITHGHIPAIFRL